MNISRADRNGVAAAIFKESFECKQSSCGDFASFEYHCTVLKDTPESLLLTIYRPPCFAMTTAEQLSTDLTNLTKITGNFNIHIDNTENKTARK